MTESDFRRNIAGNINEILKLVFNNIKENRFDSLVDFSSIPSKNLRDFWLYTSCFLGLKNVSELQEMFDNE